MIKRPLNARFREAVLDGRKITTIRKAAWPIGIPIMLYHWSGAPYRSNHEDCAAIVVEETTAIRIGYVEGDPALMCYHAERGIHRGRLLWSCEGFLSQADMDEWFRSQMKHGQWIDMVIMRFGLWNCEILDEKGRKLTVGMRVGCRNKGESKEWSRRGLTLTGYEHGAEQPYITNGGRYALAIKDHQPEMDDWIMEHVPPAKAT